VGTTHSLTSHWPTQFLSANSFLKIASAMGERQMLPKHTNSTECDAMIKEADSEFENGSRNSATYIHLRLSANSARAETGQQAFISLVPRPHPRTRGPCTSFKFSLVPRPHGHLSAAADSKTSPRNPVMCVVLHLENIASLGWILNCKFRPLNSQPLAV